MCSRGRGGLAPRLTHPSIIFLKSYFSFFIFICIYIFIFHFYFLLRDGHCQAPPSLKDQPGNGPENTRNYGLARNYEGCASRAPRNEQFYQDFIRFSAAWSMQWQRLSFIKGLSSVLSAFTSFSRKGHHDLANWIMFYNSCVIFSEGVFVKSCFQKHHST